MDLVGEGPCECFVAFMVSVVFVCLDSRCFTQKSDRKEGIGIFNVFPVVFKRFPNIDGQNPGPVGI